MFEVFKKMFQRAWIGTTLLVLIGTGVCARLGIWQLDRLEKRKAFNQHYIEVANLSPLVLNSAQIDLSQMEYRAVEISGTYDFENQVALRNQYYQDSYGYHLLTPLIMEDGTAILIDRGWIPPLENQNPADWRKYDEPAPVIIRGILRLGQTKPELGGAPDPLDVPRLDFWNIANLERIAKQMPYPIANAYIQIDINPEDVTPPIPYQPKIEISEGPHSGYAAQWFFFSALLLFGYPFYLRKQLKTETKI